MQGTIAKDPQRSAKKTIANDQQGSPTIANIKHRAQIDFFTLPIVADR
jgi:hypothetical protein